MVVIEQEQIEEAVVKGQKKPAPSSEAAKYAEEESKAEASGNGDASDGFETASDREVSDDEDGGGKGAKHVDQNDNREAESHSEQQNKVVMEQKAMAQANDAKVEGNKLFGEGQYEEALSKYELALQLAADTPESAELRSICHSNRAICFLKSGKYKDTVQECTKALELNPTYVKALIRRAEAHEKLENYEEAIADWKKILEIEPSNNQARQSIRRLEPIAAEKREKMKEEMIGKLKEMGNSILGRFGMSVDNFKAVKDPNTGSYSISFQQ